MKQLIVNADDFGYTRGVNRAIVDGCRNGIITSTSLMANGAAFEHAVGLARSEAGLDIGCHLNLVEGWPVAASAGVSHLVNAEGKFHRLSGLVWRLAGGWVPAVELERECSAQIEKLLAAGIRPSHLDTHQHTHLHPRVAAAVAAAARRYSIEWVRRPFENCSAGAQNLHPEDGTPFRNLLARFLNLFTVPFERRMAAAGLRMPDFFTGFGRTGRWTEAALEATLKSLPPGVTELMCHPGYYDADLENSPTRLRLERQAEMEIVGNPAWKSRLRDGGVMLSRFRDFAPPGAPATPAGALAMAAPASGE